MIPLSRTNERKFGLSIIFRWGEASNHLSDSLTEKYEIIPWADLVGLRNIIVHQYFGIDLKQVWENVEPDISDFFKNIVIDGVIIFFEKTLFSCPYCIQK